MARKSVMVLRTTRIFSEKNIDEVLQAHEIFFNVSKGRLATKADLSSDFGTEDVDSIIRTILDEGEMQITGKERKVANESLFRDVAKIVSEKCVNPENYRAYTVTMIEKMMRDCHVNLQPKKSAKQQALEVIRQLRAVEGFKIAPAMLEIQISLDPKLVDVVSSHILKLVHHIIRQERSAEGIFELSAVIEPDNYHALSVALDEHAKNRYCIEIIGPARHDSALNCSRLPVAKKSCPPSAASIAPTTTESIPEASPPEEPHTDTVVSPKSILKEDADPEDEYVQALKNTKQTKKHKRLKNKKAHGDYERNEGDV
uniref:Ribosome maturation protein SBDS n=1 Tax=Mesocestoides corti TaxID=53468 RepID=A0A5K3F4N3_MESCO